MNKLPQQRKSVIRILLVDDHIAMRMGISSVIENEEDMEVIAEAGNGKEAVAVALEKHPDVIILDLRMPEQDGIETIRILRKEWSKANILIYSSFANGEEIFSAFPGRSRWICGQRYGARPVARGDSNGRERGTVYPIRGVFTYDFQADLQVDHPGSDDSGICRQRAQQQGNRG